MQIDACQSIYCKGRALTLGGLGALTREKAWPDAMRAVVSAGTVHPDASLRFLKAWTRVPTHGIRKWVGDDDLMFSALRILLPPYDGRLAQRLYRGQGEGEPVGMSWTRSHHIAVKFALYGVENVDPLNLHKARIPPRPNAVVLSAVAYPEIICAPCLLGHLEGEFVLDPRNLSHSVDYQGLYQGHMRSLTDSI